ncbi:MAG: hypothetical protein RLZZ153_361 [Pseudomonadota bacterium]
MKTGDLVLPAAVWHAGRFTQDPASGVSSGFTRLDAVLPGAGWPVGALTELISPEPGIGELRLLVPMLRNITRERRFAIMLAPPLIPYGPALASFGIDTDYLLVIQASHAADRLWAIEQTLKSASFGALIAWLPQHRTRPEHLRRLQQATQSARGPSFLFRHLAAQGEASPAPLRLLLLPRPEQRLSVQILKRRGPVIAQPLLLDLPQPPQSLSLRSNPVSGTQSTPTSVLATAHSRPPGTHPKPALMH